MSIEEKGLERAGEALDEALVYLERARQRASESKYPAVVRASEKYRVAKAYR